MILIVQSIINNLKNNLPDWGNVFGLCYQDEEGRVVEYSNPLKYCGVTDTHGTFIYIREISEGVDGTTSINTTLSPCTPTTSATKRIMVVGVTNKNILNFNLTQKIYEDVFRVKEKDLGIGVGAFRARLSYVNQYYNQKEILKRETGKEDIIGDGLVVGAVELDVEFIINANCSPIKTGLC